ncbi:nuclear transport factor 2 family protein [Oxalobacteraceae bacterium A2-2]
MLKPALFLLALLATPLPAQAQAAAIPAVTPQPGSPEYAQIRALLDRLYQAFNYAPRQEPDWAAMRACFLDGAAFVVEAVPGQAARAQDIDAFITGWRNYMREHRDENVGYAEAIREARITQVGSVAHVDVMFYGREPGDPRQRQPGLDSLQLVLVDGQWKVAAFVVQRESKL